jgi:hypothetical protein
MGNRPLYKIERFHRLGMSESERLKVTALNLLEASRLCGRFPASQHPRPPLPPFPEVGFLNITTQSQRAGLPGKVVLHIVSLNPPS